MYILEIRAEHGRRAILKDMGFSPFLGTPLKFLHPQNEVYAEITGNGIRFFGYEYKNWIKKELKARGY
jgi:hypothetical protein